MPITRCASEALVTGVITMVLLTIAATPQARVPQVNRCLLDALPTAMRQPAAPAKATVATPPAV
ncbi:MAG: hypothetical protein FJ077_05260 [Cyanobacteria bacterium K_DeepCast_35m_m2_023]|nr:hypothetical protein [Cyanobacteria bacterium K_DeepCast_35m_m2_023]